jgi:hypothetical protein
MCSQDSNQSTNDVNVRKLIHELATNKYDEEIKRQDSLIQQSNSMQAAFGFYTAALFMIAPVLFDHVSAKVPTTLINVGLSTISLLVILSFLFATLVQHRFKKNAYQPIVVIENEIIGIADSLLSEAERIKYATTYLKPIQEQLSKNNDRRVSLIILSTITFSLSVVITIIGFIIGFFFTIT